MTTSAPPTNLCFGACVVRPAERQLLIDGEPAKLGARAFDLLAALIERRDRTVGKHELLDLVWPGLVVEENNLQVHVSALRKLLGPQAIATVPGRGYRFTAAVTESAAAPSPSKPDESGDAPAAAAASAQPHRPGNLPEYLPPLYGRDADLSSLQALALAHRLVSIAGAGGIGKTAVGMALAARLADAFADGVWLVELAPLSDPGRLLPSVAGVLGLPLGADASAAALAMRLRGTRPLIVLDNCEHLLDGVAELARALLEHTPGVHIVTTTQEPLRLPDEQVFRLEALALPAAGVGLAAARRTGAVALFEARAHAADPRFQLAEHNLDAVVEVCRQLDALPLAIELAAARVPLLGVEGLRARLGERLRILTAGHRLALRRHQTLRAAFDWSFGLLDAAEQKVFRRLGVFVGSFDIEQAQQVTADGEIDAWSALDHLGALVDKSLVTALPGESPRYRLLETGRAFALEKLHEATETEATMARHLQAMRAWAEPLEHLQWQVPHWQLRERCEADLDNLRAALDWAGRDGGDTQALVTLTGLSVRLLGRPEGRRRFQLAISRLDASTPPRDAMHVLLGYAYLSHPRSTSVELDATERAIALARQQGHRPVQFLGWVRLLFLLVQHNRLDEARQAANEAAQLQDSVPLAIRAEFPSMRAELHQALGDHDAATADMLEAVHWSERAGDAQGVFVAMSNLVDLQLAHRDFDAAVRLGRELIASIVRPHPSNASAFLNLATALTFVGEHDEALQMARAAIPLLQRRGRLEASLDTAALLALRRGHRTAAALALGRSRAVAATSGDLRGVNEQRAYDAALSALRELFSADALERLLGEGAALSDEEAVALALAE